MKAGLRAALLAFLTGAAALCAQGCDARFSGFPFRCADGGSVELRQSPAASGDAARFSLSDRRSTSPTFRLASVHAMPTDGQAFALTYTGSFSGVRLTVFSGANRPIAAAALPSAGSARLRFLVPMERGALVWGFQLSADPDGSPEGSPEGSLQMLAAGTAQLVHGFAVDDGALVMDGSVAVRAMTEERTKARISSAARSEMERGVWRISLGLRRGRGGEIRFSGADGRKAVFSVRSEANADRLDICRGGVGFLPVDIEASPALRSLEISSVADGDPIPADPGVILEWDRNAWRRPDYELFAWDRFPDVLILDTADYAAQDDMFKRLAFFVEKAGFAGSIPHPRLLEGKHAYNAHDYRAEDLARFFSAARKQGAELTPGETVIEGVLERAGIIVPSGQGFAPGRGAVISISRESSPLLRELLLTHECFHGVYFSMPAFRDATQRAWDVLTPLEKRVWREFLASRAYNTADPYLVVNEFQSYLMQQGRRGVRGFQDFTLNRLRDASPRAAELVERLRAEDPDSFLRSFDLLDQALREAGGPGGGHAASVRREE